VIDGEIVCLDAAGASDFYALMFNRQAPVFCAFDLLAVDGQDLRSLPLLERKRRLRLAMPRRDSHLRYCDHVRSRGREFFALACQHDLEGIVAKWKHGTYQTDGESTSWLKIKNPEYSQAEGRPELFEQNRLSNRARMPRKPRVLVLR
jgi:bifunctional non-homologous end joining protein LigD